MEVEVGRKMGREMGREVGVGMAMAMEMERDAERLVVKELAPVAPMGWTILLTLGRTLSFPQPLDSCTSLF